MRSKTSEKGIYKEKNGSYTVDTSFNKRRISRRGFVRLSEAKKFKSMQLSEFSLDQNSSSYKFTYEELLERFIEKHLPKIRESTKERYLLDINTRITPYFQYMKLNQIDQNYIERFQLFLLKQGKLSNKSINNCTGTLGVMFRKAEFWGLIDKSPVKLERLEVPDASAYNWWDKREDIEKFVKALKESKNEPYDAALLLALECGLRLGEIVALSKLDVNLSLCQITVSKSWNDKLKKGGPTKSGKNRIIKFSSESVLFGMLEKKLDQNQSNDIIFTTRTGKRVIGRKLSNEVFKKWKVNLGLPEITFHGLRHTFASWYMIRGGSLWDLYKIMGHSDFKTTANLYAHLSSDAATVPKW